MGQSRACYSEHTITSPGQSDYLRKYYTVLRMQYFRYSKKFRHEVVNAALKAYDEIQRMANNGKRLLYRPYDWNREERDKAKKN